VKSSNLHPQRQILPLHVGRANLAVVRDAQDFCYLRSRHARRRIAARARIRCRVQLGDRGISRTVAEVPCNGWTIRAPRIGTDLSRAFDAPAQILDKGMGINRITFAYMAGGNDLGKGSSAM
jgi:hypothetical protein